MFFTLFIHCNWALGQAASNTSSVECGVSMSNSMLPPETCDYAPPACVRTVKVNVVFIQRTDGTGNFTDDGPPMGVTNTSGGTSNSSLPASYNGQQYAQDLICKVNSLMDNNQPDNMCNGWAFYTNPASPLYNPEFQMPDATAPTMIRFALQGVRYLQNDNNYYYVGIGNSNQLNSQPGYDIANEIELYVYANSPPAITYSGIASTSSPGTIILGQMNNNGGALLAAGLETHELGHVLGLYHTFVTYEIAAGYAEADALACPYYDDVAGYGVCNEDTGHTNTDGDDNDACNSPVIRGGPDQSFGDVKLQHSWQHSNILTAAYGWKWTLGNQPEEFGSNIMSNSMGANGHYISPCQLIIMHQQLTNLGTGYLINNASTASLWPNVQINGGINNSTCASGSLGIDHECYPLGTPIPLDAGSNWGAGATYSWSTGATTQTINVTATNAGATYTVTVTGSNGCTGSDQIAVAEIPTVSLPNGFSFCATQWTGPEAPPYTVPITATTTGNIVAYNWYTNADAPYAPSTWQTFTQSEGGPNFGLPWITSTVQVPPDTNPPLDANLYQVVVTASNGCTASATIMLDGHQSPVAQIPPVPSITGLQACANENLLATANVTNQITNGSDSYTFVWSTPWAVGQTGQNITITNPNAPNQSNGFVYVTVTDDNGCTGIAGSYAWFLPPVNANITGNTNLCGSGSTTLTATGGQTYVWSNGSTTASSGTITTPGTYTVTVTQNYQSSAQNGTPEGYQSNPPYPCSAVTSVNVTATPPITPILQALPTPICPTDAPINLTQYVSNYANVMAGGSFTIIGTSTVPQSISQVTTTFNPALFTPGTYTIQYGYQPAGCNAAFSQIQTIVLQSCTPLDCIAQQTYLYFDAANQVVSASAPGALLNYTAPADADNNFVTWTPASNPFGAGLGLATNPVKINGTITIPAGSEIRIDGMNFVFGPNGRIDIKRRGQLTLKRSTFEGDPTCNTMWQGFRVWGPGVSTAAPGNEGGEQQDAGGGIHTGMLLFDGDPDVTTNVVVRDALIGVATTRLDNYNLATVVSSLASFNAGGIPYALNNSTVSVLPQIVGPGSTQAEGYGGGWLHIRKASGARFENCFYGTLYTQYQGISYINPAALAADGITGYKIDAATFTTNGNLRYPFVGKSTEVGVAGLKVTKTKLSIANSTFENLVYGIRANDLRLLNIRSFNQFNNCLRGISTQVSNLGATQFTRIEGNTFNSCTLSIQADALQTLITGNTIVGPVGTLDQSVGIFMRDSDYSIGGAYGAIANYAGNFISDVTIGIATIGGTEDPAMVISPEIKNNTISRTYVAIHAINDNDFLDIHCNYLDYTNRGINVRSWNGTQGNLKDQGDCLISTDQHPSFNSFLPLGGSAIDLFADASSLPFTYSDIDAPSLSTNNSPPPAPPLITKVGCPPTPSPCNIYSPSPLGKLIDNSTDTKTKYAILSEWLRKYQADSNYVAAAALLEQNTALPIAAQKMIQQYYDTENYAAANNLLEGIDRTKLEAQQFYTLQKLLIALKQEGKSYAQINATQEATLLDIANSQTSVGYRAQAVLYQARGYEFPAIIPPINDTDVYGYTVFKTDNNINAGTKNFSLLYPNPAKSQLFLDYALGIDEQATISLFDVNGRMLKQTNLAGDGKLEWSTDMLPTGLYYYQIQKNNEKVITHKVIIIQ